MFHVLILLFIDARRNIRHIMLLPPLPGTTVGFWAIANYTTCFHPSQMQVETVATHKLNWVLGSSHEERWALGKLQVRPEHHRAQPGGTGNFCLWLLFLHFQLEVSRFFLAVCSTHHTLPRKQPWEEVETAGRTRVQRCHGDLLLYSPHTPGSSWAYFHIRHLILIPKE